ncbi:hypothetical protein BJ170DRAFT_104615 [Xylariales sp. AK1849]|nr:hypothetical protein BJ170DRAFT_104615 [Xylariales sp. AK1849]
MLRLRCGPICLQFLVLLEARNLAALTRSVKRSRLSVDPWPSWVEAWNQNLPPSCQGTAWLEPYKSMLLTDQTTLDDWSAGPGAQGLDQWAEFHASVIRCIANSCREGQLGFLTDLHSQVSKFIWSSDEIKELRGLIGCCCSPAVRDLRRVVLCLVLESDPGFRHAGRSSDIHLEVDHF